MNPAFITRLVAAFTLTLALTGQQTFNPVVPDDAPGTAVQQDDTPEAYPGQHDHAVPPEGWQCMRPPVDLKGDQSHWCSCERVCDTETQVVHEDMKCQVWCHMDHCTCSQDATMTRCMPPGQQ